MTKREETTTYTSACLGGGGGGVSSFYYRPLSEDNSMASRGNDRVFIKFIREVLSAS